MDRIIREMLELSRLESKTIELKYEDVSFKKVCEGLIDRYRPIFMEKSIRVNLEGDKIIKSDDLLMERVIDNYFINALDNTPDEGEIRITISNDRVEFFNSGNKIPEALLNEIWQPYKKAVPARNHTKGTGIGFLSQALEGAAAQGAETEFIHLYDLNYKGCTSCFACKLINGKNYGKCAVQDDLAEVLKKIEKADAFVLGSPIYFGEVTGQMRSFLERLLFQYLVYDKEGTVLTPKKTPVCFIYTMNGSEDESIRLGYGSLFMKYETMLKRFLGFAQSLVVMDKIWQLRKL